MKEFLDKIKDLIAQGNIDNALTQVYNLLSLAASDLKNDAIILRGRLSKLKSDSRKGLLKREDENMELSHISVGTLSLLDDIEAQSEQFKSFIADISESVERIDKTTIPILEDTTIRKKLFVSDSQKATILQRLSNVKERNMSLKALWIDDNLPCTLSEQRLINALNVQIDSAHNSEMAESMIKNTTYHFIVSDMLRNDNPTEGVDFITKLVKQDIYIPAILYITKYNTEKGVPPHVFGVTNKPSELLHLVMDIIERI
jgi:Effector-associated domain 11